MHVRYNRAIVTTVVACFAIITAVAATRLASIDVPAEAPWLAPELTSITVDRLLATVAVGFALGVAGVLLRTASANPLADPEIAGVNAGATFGAVSATTLVGATALLPGALAGATVASALTIVVGTLASPVGSAQAVIQRMVLFGIAISAMFSAFTAIFLIYDEAQLSTVLAWMSGSLGGVRFSDLVPLLAVEPLLVVICVIVGRSLDTLILGDEASASVGAHPQRIRITAMGIATVLVATSVAASGPIGFLGLMSAAAAHRLAGPRHRIALPLAGVIGASILLLADTVGQWVWAPAETPVGIITALAGVPVLLWSIQRRSTKLGSAQQQVHA